MQRILESATKFTVVVIAAAIVIASIGVALLIAGWIWLGVESVWGMIF
ncbi:hypothetical protein JTF06_12030 [Desemzia sp. RIT804]|nr:hypothetical protein [Desemzia sp. RIT 804]MBM6615614.1 hypothetical protein [Desemzia sp. RIT 804]